MRKLTLVLIVVLTLGLMACAANQVAPPAEPGPVPSVIAQPESVPLDKKGKITFIGSGFESGQAVRLLFKAADGITADIGYALKPEPVANERGAWSTVWSYGRFVSKKLIKEGVYAIVVTNTDYNILTSAPIDFRK